MILETILILHIRTDANSDADIDWKHTASQTYKLT